MNPVALITGSGRGLGAFLATELARLGFDIALHYHSSREGAEKTASAVESAGQRSLLLPADLSNPRDVEQMIENLDAAFGRLDVLINNSGVYHEEGLLELTPEQWFEGFNTTATAVFLVTRSSLRLLRKAPRGRVINIGDSSADRPGARDQAMSYHIGKSGVWMLTRSYAQQEASHGIAVNMISPGYLENSVGLPDPSTMPAGRFGSFDDIGTATRFLIETESPYLTGSNLVVSGGWNLR